MAFWKSKAANLSESVIRHAMANSRSNVEAARFIGVSKSTYNKYAKMYIDSKTNMNLYDLHRFSKKKIEKPRYVRNISLPDILEGKYPDYKPQVLKRRLIREGYKKEECSLCGFSERRVTDYTVPLVVAWRDGNRLNFSEDNLELICYNCYYLAYGNIKSRSEKPVFEAAY